MDRIHEETTVDCENNLSTGPSNHSGFDMIVINGPNSSRQYAHQSNYRTLGHYLKKRPAIENRVSKLASSYVNSNTITL